MSKRTSVAGLTIGRKLALSFGAMILLTILVGLLSMATTRFLLQPAVDTATHATNEAFNATDMMENSLQARRHEKDFLLNYENLGVEAARLEYLPPFQENIQQIIDTTNKSWGYEGESAASTAYELGVVTEIRDNIQAYNEAFLAVVDLIEQRGTGETGLVGELEIAETLLHPDHEGHEHEDFPQLQIVLLELSEANQIYLLNQNQENIDRVHNLIPEFKTVVQTIDIDSHERDELTANVDEYLATFNTLVALDQTIATAIIDYKDSAQIIIPLAEELQETLLADQNEALQGYKQVTQTARILNTAFIIAAVLLGSALTVWLSRNIATPLGRMTRVAADIAAGDLEQQAEASRQDEIGQLGQAFNTMTASLQTMMISETTARQLLEKTIDRYLYFVTQVTQGDLTQQLSLAENNTQESLNSLGEHLNRMVKGLREMAKQSQQISTQLAITADEIFAASSQQAASASEQNAAVTQTMATVNEVRSTVEQTSTRADEVASSARLSVDVGENGLTAVQSSIVGMEMIQSRVEDIAHNILDLSEQTQQIGQIISTVDELAEQSKLLALNASIEAARAGEEGRGFAVVAMEVRTLAEESRQATEQISLILNEIQQATNTAVMATEEGSKQVDSGMGQVNTAGDVIENLAQVIRESAQAATQIAASTNQQTSGINQLANAIENIRQASIESQASTQQTKNAAENLTTIARLMENTIAQYKL